MIIYTCPNCGGHLTNEFLDVFPPIPMKRCSKCGWSWTGKPESIEYRPFNGNTVSNTNDTSWNSNFSLLNNINLDK